MFDNEIDSAISRLTEQWDIAERRIKKAEMVKGGEIVASAIFELRYAGRKLVEANQLILKGTWKNDPDEKAKILSALSDATEDCVKSKHDAIDAMMLFVSKWFQRTEDKIGLSKIQTFFPEYIEITGLIAEIQDKIADSRANRVGSRDGYYNEIERDGFDRVLSLFESMKRSDNRINIEVTREARREKNRSRRELAGLIIAALAIVTTIFFEWDKISGFVTEHHLSRFF